jgi:hypothetical protein
MNFIDYERLAEELIYPNLECSSVSCWNIQTYLAGSDLCNIMYGFTLTVRNFMNSMCRPESYSIIKANTKIKNFPNNYVIFQVLTAETL